MVTVNNAINNTIGASNSGVTNTLSVTNPSNTASSQALVNVTVGGGTAGDAFTTYTIAGATNWSEGIDNSDSDAYVLAASAALGTTNVMRASVGGQINYPLQSSFMAYLASTTAAVTGDGTAYTVILDTKSYDQNSDYNLGTGTFTAPITGHYLFNMIFGIYIGTTTVTSISARLVTTTHTYLIAGGNATILDIPTNGNGTRGGSIIVPMTAGNTATLTLTVNGSSKTSGLAGENANAFATYFSGQLLS